MNQIFFNVLAIALTGRGHYQKKKKDKLKHLINVKEITKN